MGQIENARVLAAVPPIDPIAAIQTGVELNEKVLKTLKDAVKSSAIIKKIGRWTFKQVSKLNRYCINSRIQDL